MRLDAAVPEEVVVARPFDLAVAVVGLGSPPLQVDELTRVRTAPAQVEWPEGATAVTLRAAVHAPDCDILGQPFQMFRLHAGEPSPVVFFSLRPRQTGELPIRVTLYQQFLALGSARLTATATEREAGRVMTGVRSTLRAVDPVEEHVWQLLTGQERMGIYSLLMRAFSMDELHTLCDAAGIDWDALPGTTRQRKASELISYSYRHGEVETLIEHIIAACPNWIDLIEDEE